MNRLSLFLRSLILPVTPLVVLAVISVIWFLLIFVTSPASAGLIVVLAFAITFGTLLLYLFDRILVSRLALKFLIPGELFLGLLFAVYIYYQQGTIDVNIVTEEEYIVVLFDSKENLLEDFQPKGHFGKELYTREHIVHVDSILYGRKNFRIKEIEEWNGFTQTEGKINIQGRPVKYILRAKTNRQPEIQDLLSEIEQ